MLSKCANPQCRAAFLYLHQGKLFRIETEASSHQDPAADSGARKPVRRLEYFWLCDDCASQMRLARKNGEIVTVPREQTRAAATASCVHRTFSGEYFPVCAFQTVFSISPNLRISSPRGLR